MGIRSAVRDLLIITLLLGAPLAARDAAAQSLVSGDTGTGAIFSGGGSATWTFSANAGDSWAVRIGELSQAGALSPRIRVYSPAAVLLGTASSTVASELSGTAASSGTYSVTVDDAAGTTASGTYQLTLALTGHAVTVPGGDEGGPLTNGQRHTGAISVGELDVWTVTANAGDAIVARIGEATAGSALTPQLRLYSPSGTLLDSGYGVSATEVSATAPSSGEYLVVVGDYSTGYLGNGAYALTLARSNTAVTTLAGDEGGALTNGTQHGGVVELGDLDLWTVDLAAGEAIKVRMGETTAGSALTPELLLYSPAGVLLDWGYGTGATEVSANAPLGGQYLVVAADYSTGFAGNGGYRLTMVRTGGAVSISGGDDGGPLDNGAMHGGAVELGDLDPWTVTLTAGDAIVVRMGETTAGSALTPELLLYSPAGVLLDWSYGTGATEVAATAPLSGQYLVVAADYSTGFLGSGGYRLSMDRTGGAVSVSGGDEGGPLGNGTMELGAASLGDLDAWTFSATAGDAFVVRMGETVPGSALTPQLRVYSPAGVLMGSGYGTAATEVSGRATVSGEYLVVASDYSTAFLGSGAYRVTLARTGAPVAVSIGDEGGATANGAMHTGTADVGDLDAWTVSANAGDAIVVRSGEIAAGSSLTPQLRIFSPAGVLLDGSYGTAADEVAVTAPATGEYLVVASDYSTGFGGSGDYRMTVARSGAAFVTSEGDEGGPLYPGLSGGLLPVGDLDLWSIDALAGQALVASMEEIVIGSTLTPELRLYSPAGVLLRSAYGVSRAQVNAVAPMTGMYLLVASDYSTGFGGSGAYRLAPSYTTGVDDTPRSFPLAFAGASPNPCAGRTTLRFSLPAAGDAQLAIFDAQGRLVRTLLDERGKPAGEYAVEWNGGDSGGARLRPGVYLARLEAAGRSLVQKVLLVQ